MWILRTLIGLALVAAAQAVVYEECEYPELHPGLKAIWQQSADGLSEIDYEFEHAHTEHLQHVHELQLHIENDQTHWVKRVPVCGPTAAARIECYHQLARSKALYGTVQLPFPYQGDKVRSELWVIEHNEDPTMQVVYKLCSK